MVLRPSQLLRILLPASIVLLWGCGGGGGGEIPLKAPTDLAGRWLEGGATSAVFTWTRAMDIDTFDGYYLEGQFGAGPYVNILDNDYLPAAFYMCPVTIDPAAGPELQPFNVRLKAFRGLTSPKYAYSNVTTLTMPVRQAGTVTVTSAPVGLQVNWTNNSAVADRLVLERGVIPYGSQTPTWTTLPGVAFGATAYTDLEAPEASTVSYRVVYGKGQASSFPSTSLPFYTHLRSPENLTATGGQGQVHLAWTNRSSPATSLAVYRISGIGSSSPNAQIATLPPTATSFDDLGLGPGCFTYRVEAQLAGYGWGASSENVKAITLPVTTSDIVLDPSALVLPIDANRAVPMTDGTWTLGVFQLPYTARVFTPSGGGHAAYDLPSAAEVLTPGLVRDGSGRPHVVYSRAVAVNSSAYVLLHAWHDGTGWQTEEITRPVASARKAQVCLDAAGEPVVFWYSDSIDFTGIRYASRSAGGAWTVEDPVAGLAAFAGCQGLGMTLDSAGAPVILVAKDRAFHVLRRAGDGTWTGETLPTDFPTDYYPSYAAITATADGDLHMLYPRNNYSPVFVREIVYQRRTGGAWTLPARIDSWAQDVSISSGLVPHPAGDRFAFLASAANGMTLCEIGRNGVKTVLLGYSYSGLHLGFTDQGKYRILAACASKIYGSGTEVYCLLQER